MKNHYLQKANKRDKRKHYYLMLDTETANSLEDPFVYDIGLAIVDKKGTIYHSESLIIEEIFFGYSWLMESAYYAEKIPLYYEKLRNKESRLVSYKVAKFIIKDLCEAWDVKAIVSHNGRFDYRSTAVTQRRLTNSKYRYFLPYGIPLWCTMRMAEDTICKMKGYINWCNELPEKRLTKNGRVRKTAELLYQFITDDEAFVEDHTGLEDCKIEAKIMAYCIKQKKKMRKLTFA